MVSKVTDDQKHVIQHIYFSCVIISPQVQLGKPEELQDQKGFLDHKNIRKQSPTASNKKKEGFVEVAQLSLVKD